MTREDFISYGIDYDSGMKLFRERQELFEKFLRKFPKDESYNRLTAALDADDCEQAFKEAHTLKGVSANLSLKSLAAAASDVTEALRAGNLEEGKKLMPAVDEKYAQIREFLVILGD
jgi:HPt (histidine-containing phosphotransfer) domain-containing protein